MERPTSESTDPDPSEDGLCGPLIPPRFGRGYLIAECTLLFVAIPVALYVYRHSFGVRIIPTLVGIGVGCLGVLLLDARFDRRRLWNTALFAAHLKRTLWVFVPSAGLVGILIAVLDPDALFGLPRRSPRLWLLVMGFYPVFSVYPQELIFRTFFFHRYRALFPNAALMIGVSGAAFGLAHLFFANWIAPVMTTLGGVLFAQTYARSGSTLQAGLEHALWGNFVFTIGLGLYFYGGAIP